MRLYKHHITPFLQVLLVLCALATLASCVSDKFWEQLEASRNPEPETTPYYLSLTVMDSSGISVGSTRDDGSISEDSLDHRIGEEGNYVILLNANKSLYGVYALKLYKWQEYKPEDGEAAYIYITHFYHDEKEELPQYGFVVMNANKNISDWLEGLPKNSSNSEADILEKVWKETSNPKKIGFSEGDGDNPKYFTLTNSAYINEGNSQVAVRIPQDRIYKSLDLAKKNPVTVYVERMVAKFSFSFSDEENSNHTFTPNPEEIPVFNGYKNEGIESKYALIPDYDMKKCRIRVTGWGINALETQNYIFKNISASEYGKRSWASHSHSSCWSEDPHYDKDKYPWQYTPAINGSSPDFNYYSDSSNPSPLKNYSYNELNDDEWNRIIYTPENTYGEEVMEMDLDSRTNLLAGTHLIVCATLEIEKENKDSNGDDYEIHETLYRDRTGSWYKTEKDCFMELVRTLNYVLESRDTMSFYSYDWNGNGGQTGNAYIAKPSGKYQIYYNNAPLTPSIVKGWNLDHYLSNPPMMILNGDGRLLPWTEELISCLSIKSEDGYQLPIYDKNGKRVEDLTASNLIKSLFLEWFGAVDYYKDGMMYYAAPISHNAPKAEDSNKTQDKLGDYGVARNHWYNFKLKEINRIGTSVYKPEEPIVPNQIPVFDQLNFDIKILDWHRIDRDVPIFQ